MERKASDFARDSDLKVSTLHNWGKVNKLVEKSPTLKEFVDAGELPDGLNYTAVFEKIMLELALEFKMVDIRNSPPNFVIINVASEPVWAFGGTGPNRVAAIEEASQKGIKFFITVSGDKVLF